ncbi:alpha/beta fold hydrolase [Pseudoruegeria sp. HB172150]|uniref:alpha/beta fold hydrolase n=1 Tax=Pseudoruegeria sp. HB172150 TaxID=2721164 RepID=UPI0015537A67|nr:alpha/beta hydrolase [Pseudoruegeria sp. HB172150]
MWSLDTTYDTSAGQVRAGSAGDGPPLVLAHGWPWSSYTWHRVIPALAGEFRLYYYDMPGFGRSQMDTARPASLDTQGEVMAEMLEHWGLTAPRLVAHDFGGAVSLRAHLLHGQEYDRLILMNVVAMRPWGSEFFAHVGRHIDAFTGLPPHIHAAVVDAYIRSALASPLPDEDIVALKAPWLDERGQRAFYAQFALADERFTAEVEPQFGALRCPTAVLWGTEDPWIPLARGEALADRIGAPLKPLPSLGHLPQLEAPEQVADRLLAELR